jgi:hypothetical protein
MVDVSKVTFNLRKRGAAQQELRGRADWETMTTGTTISRGAQGPEQCSTH